KSLVEALVRESPLPRDALPYTDEFQRLKREAESQLHTPLTDAEFWQAVSSIAKGGIAGGVRRKSAPRTETLTTAQQLEILRLLPEGIGSRDQLPYTPQFDDLRQRFSSLTGT